MVRVSRGGKGKVLTIKLDIFPCGNADTQKNLTIACPDKETQFKTTLSDAGLNKFRNQILQFYDEYVIKRKQ